MIQKFVQSFSHGQITIPKEFREKLGLEENFWLKLILDEEERIIAEPIEELKTSASFAQNLLSVKGNWFNVKDWKKIRNEAEKRIKSINENTD